MDINERNNEAKSVVHHAMMSRQTTAESVEELLKRQVTVNMRDDRGRNEIYCAVEEVSFHYSQAELDQRAEVIQCLAKAGVNVNERNVEGISPLHLATLKDDLGILVALLDCGADVMQRTNTGATALHWASKNYNMLHVLLHSFLDGDHDINVTDNYGSTALHWAVWFKGKCAVQSLLQVGCDFTIKDKAGNSPEALAEKIDFVYYSWLLEDDMFRKMECLELQDPKLECSGADPLIACPHLKYIRKENGELHTGIYLDHLNLHKSSIQSCLQRSLTFKEMGLFYPLQDNHWVPEKFRRLFNLVVERLGKEHPLFACESKLAGSMHEGTKVKIPDEFDYLFILSRLSLLFSPVEASGFPESFVKLKLKTGATNGPIEKYVTSEGFLDSQMFLQDFYKCLNQELIIILRTCQEFNHILLFKSLNEISPIVAALQFLVFGQEAKLFQVSVDVVPNMLFEDWTPKSLRQLDANFRKNETLGHFSVIMKTPDRYHVKDFSQFFRISYAYLEQSIIRNIPYPVKKGYILLKIFAESGYLPKVVDHDNNRALKSYITSYHMKTCLLQEWYEWKTGQHSKSVTETRETPSDDVSTEWARTIMIRYRKSIENKILPSFFNPSKNLFGIDALNDGMQEQDMFVQLFGLLEHILNVATSEDTSCEILYSRE